MITEIFLIRHGHAVKVGGNYVIAPLTSVGQKQAETTGKFLAKKLDVLCSSPLKRTMETARVIASETRLKIEIVDGMRELRRRELPLLFLCEALSIFWPFKRYLHTHLGKKIWWPIIGRASNSLLDIANNHPNQKIGIVTHSGIISSILAWLEPSRRRKWWRHTVGNCSITTLQILDERIKIVSVDNQSHLETKIETSQEPEVEPLGSSEHSSKK